MKLNKNYHNPVKILVELPTWIGDCIMSTPAIDNVIGYFGEVELTFIGSLESIEIIKRNLLTKATYVLDRKIKSIYYLSKKLDFFDYFFSFRGSSRSKLLKILINAKNKHQFNKKLYPNRHQVEKYVDFINLSLNISSLPGPLNINFVKSNKRKTSKILGLNPGATYGSAKRWYPEKFAKIAIELSGSFDILIFGGKNEIDFAQKIEDQLVSQNIKNFCNLSGQTSITELTKYISDLDIFITGDSGPMHIAASLKIPTVALFGPTNPIETSQWKNAQSIIVKKNLGCQPCMKRSCPLGHHKCMKLIETDEVIDSVNQLAFFR